MEGRPRVLPGSARVDKGRQESPGTLEKVRQTDREPQGWAPEDTGEARLDPGLLTGGPRGLRGPKGPKISGGG